MTESSGSSGRHAENQAGVGRQTWSVTRAIRRAISRGNAPPTRKDARETDSRRRRNRRGTPRGCGDRGAGHDRKWPLPPWKDRRERGQFPGRYGIGGIHPGGTQMEGMGPHGGRADPILPASQEQRDVRKGGEPAGAGTVPKVRKTGPATKPEEAPKEPARWGTGTKARLPFL